MRLTPLIMASLAIGFTTSLQAADFTFKYAHSQTDEAPRSESMRYFKEALEERSDGRIDVELYFNGTLGKEEDVLQQVQMGLIQGYRGGLFAQANPAYLIYTMPFLFTTPEQAIDVMEGELGQAINESARESQLHIPVTGVAGGMRQLTNYVSERLFIHHRPFDWAHFPRRPAVSTRKPPGDAAGHCLSDYYPVAAHSVLVSPFTFTLKGNSYGYSPSAS